jgi:hypothetical protein
MQKYKIVAKSVGLLEDEIEANNEDEAYEKLEELLENGDVPETDGWIGGKRVELITKE